MYRIEKFENGMGLSNLLSIREARNGAAAALKVVTARDVAGQANIADQIEGE